MRIQLFDDRSSDCCREMVVALHFTIHAWVPHIHLQVRDRSLQRDVQTTQCYEISNFNSLGRIYLRQLHDKGLQEARRVSWEELRRFKQADLNQPSCARNIHLVLKPDEHNLHLCSRNIFDFLYPFQRLYSPSHAGDGVPVRARPTWCPHRLLPLPQWCREIACWGLKVLVASKHSSREFWSRLDPR